MMLLVDILFASRCTIVINEVNSSFDDGKNDFIELKAVGCTSKERPAMKQFTMIRLAASMRLNDIVRDQPKCYLNIDMLVNFYHLKFRALSEYFVISADSVENSESVVDLKFSNNVVVSRENQQYVNRKQRR